MKTSSLAIQSNAPHHEPFQLMVGTIGSDPAFLSSLFLDIKSLCSLPCILSVSLLVLDNGGNSGEIKQVIDNFRQGDLSLAYISEAQQRADTINGAFGNCYKIRQNGQVGIAQARTMLQHYLGSLMRSSPGAIGWLLDEDMRIDERANNYIPWLPEFRKQGVDVLLGQYEGASPNPPLNGIHVLLVDILHNLRWLRQLDSNATLPDRQKENQAQRDLFPDYYYDLSRKHTGHLEKPHWIEPAFSDETVGSARGRLIALTPEILNGNPLTRPLRVTIPDNPIDTAKDSVNRGGITFVLTHAALTTTPNITLTNGNKEARRSDMIWAIINRNYRKAKIQSVGFPIIHSSKTCMEYRLNISKVQSEIIGSVFYAALTEFLESKPHHQLNFLPKELDQICSLVKKHYSIRFQALSQSFERIRILSHSLENLLAPDELSSFIVQLKTWFTEANLAKIQNVTSDLDSEKIKPFLSCLREITDSYEISAVDITFIQQQLDQ